MSGKVKPHIRASQKPYIKNGKMVIPKEKKVQVNIKPHEAKIFNKHQVVISQTDKDKE